MPASSRPRIGQRHPIPDADLQSALRQAQEVVGVPIPRIVMRCQERPCVEARYYVMGLLWGQGYSVREVARTMGYTQGTVQYAVVSRHVTRPAGRKGQEEGKVEVAGASRPPRRVLSRRVWEQVVGEVCAYTQVPVASILSRARDKEVVWARRCLVRFLYNRGYDLYTIAEVIERDWATVYHLLWTEGYTRDPTYAPVPSAPL